MATPFLIEAAGGGIEEVVVLCGEALDASWNEAFAESLRPAKCRIEARESFGYLSEQKAGAAEIRAGIRRTLKELLAEGGKWWVWAHNPGVGRNLILADELAALAGRKEIALVFHHHDWWFDNRWRRWGEFRRFGFRTRRDVARAIFPAGGGIRHAVINRRDLRVMRTGFGSRVFWLPNMAEGGTRKGAARGWRERVERMRDELGIGEEPFWLLPCRLLRRKNIAEAILLTRWLRPEGWLLTTGGVSSAMEEGYGRALRDAIEAGGWKVRMEVLGGGGRAGVGVGDLLGGCEAAVLTSLQEGFGLPYLEAAIARRPLIAREIPAVWPDLRRLGFRFGQSYREIWVEMTAFDLRAEEERQDGLFREWREEMPAGARRWLKKPRWLESGRVPFSRLTLEAQLEVLRRPVEISWEMGRRLNPFLGEWRERILGGGLEITKWPERADDWLGGRAYGRALREVFSRAGKSFDHPGGEEMLQDRFIRETLRTENLFPLLWRGTEPIFEIS